MDDAGARTAREERMAGDDADLPMMSSQAGGGADGDGRAVAGDIEDGDGMPSGSSVSGRVIAVVLVVAVVVIAVAGFAWLDVNGHRTLPGDPLSIQTDPPPPSGFVCGADVIPPSRLLVVGDSLTLIASDGGADIAVVWPADYAARLVQGIGGLYDPTGFLVAQEGENLQERFFGSTEPDGAFHVCRIASD